MKPTTAKTATLRTESAALASAISAQVAAVSEFVASGVDAVAPEPTPPDLPNPVSGGHFIRDPVTGALSLNPAFHAPQPE